METKRIFWLCLLILPTSAVADGYGFMTPSGNIYCNGAVEVSEITCTIVERTGPPAQPQPGSCSGTWGHRFNLGPTGPATLSCGGPPTRANYSDIAAYGLTGQFGDITCRSESAGLTCENTSGNGFFLSRAKQETF